MYVTNIQWKGTDLCMDFNCPNCDRNSHFDGFGAYYIQCPNCEHYFEMPSDVLVKDVGTKKPEGWALYAEED